MNILINCCSAALMLCASASCYADSEDGKDCDGCSDSGLMARYPGSILFGADHKAYEEAILATGPSTRNDGGDNVAPKTSTETGKRIRAFYIAPAERSGLEVFANYQAALEKAGMSTIWTCSGDQQCGPEFLSQATEAMHLSLAGTAEAHDGFTLAEAPRYLLAKQERPQGNLHVAVFVADLTEKQRAGVYVIQVEDKPMDKGMATTQTTMPAGQTKPAVVASKPQEPIEAAVQAAALSSNLAQSGQVNLYGIHFDIDKADIKPESKPQLDEIAKLLLANPGLTLRVSGHTDNSGIAEHNQLLSKHRAEAIVAALTGNYGIAANRLTSAGLGASLPVASNDSDEGRAMNRRVELIKQ